MRLWVVHTHLSGVVHDLVAQFGLGNVFSQLFDPSPSGTLGTVEVYQLVTLVLGSVHGWILLQKLLDHGKLASEQWILFHVHLVGVHLQKIKVQSRDDLKKTREGIFDLYR